jgi:hypothetical protein
MDATSSSPATWQSYEQVAQYLLEQFAGHFNLGRVEGKQIVAGSSGTDWELDAKALRRDSDAFLIVECRRHTTSRLKQEAVAGLAFRISDVGATGAILVTPLDLQSGAKAVAESAGIQHVILRPDSTTSSYLMRHLNAVFVGLTDEYCVRLTDSASIRIEREDGSIEEREVGNGI